MMNRAAFFTALRKRDSGLFGTSLSQRQVDGTEALLDVMDGWPIDHAAHVLAEVYHETGGGMYPVKETVFPHSKDKHPSDAQVIARLDRAWAKGQLPWVSKPYWRGGLFGRGQIQITHEPNYRKASALVGIDLIANPRAALRLNVSAKLATEGCRTGLYTGKRLDQFEGPEFDHYNARAIVNGDRKKNGAKVSGYARAFTQSMMAAGWKHATALDVLTTPTGPIFDETPNPPRKPEVPAPAPARKRGGWLWSKLFAGD